MVEVGRDLEIVSQEYVNACAKLGELYFRQGLNDCLMDDLKSQINSLHEEAKELQKKEVKVE